MEQVTLKTMQKDMESLKKVVKEMKEYLEDCFLTAEEEENLERARKELEEGNTISLEELELELKNAKS